MQERAFLFFVPVDFELATTIVSSSSPFLYTVIDEIGELLPIRLSEIIFTTIGFLSAKRCAKKDKRKVRRTALDQLFLVAFLI